MKRKMFNTFECIIIFGFGLFILLDTFVIKREYSVVKEETVNSAIQTSKTEVYLDEDEYVDENISIKIDEYTYNDTCIYVADVKVSSLEYLYSAFADNKYGKNITAKTSEIASDNNAILAINGDYYGARNSGYVLRNGVLYRSTAAKSQEDLIINADGSFSFINESEYTAEEIEALNPLQVYSFGPALIVDGQIAVSENEEVGKAMSSNPRTAICEVEPLHYLLIVSDGRTEESEGLSLYELATFIETLGVKNAYNLDGGGSSTMVFNNTIVNYPTTSGNRLKERSVSDAICIGY